MQPKFSIILPTRNEEKNIEKLLKAILKYKPYEIIISDFSQDKTLELAEKILKRSKVKWKLIRVNEKGKGIAIKKGFEVASGNFVVTMDADFGHRPQDLPKLLKEAEKFDLIVPRRLRVDSFFRKLLGYAFRFFVLLFFGLNIDTQSTFKVIRKEWCKKIDFFTKGWAWDLEFIYKCKKAGARISTKPIIIFGERKSGKSKINFFTPFKMFIELLKIRIKTF